VIRKEIMTEPFRVAATGHSLNYLPEYVASEQGFFEEENLAVEAIVPKPWDLVLDELAAGTSAVALGGIWVPSMYLGRASRYTPFAQVAARAPLALLGRESERDFAWGSLRGSTVLMKGSNGASVGMFLKLLLAENGIDEHEVRFVQDLDGAMLSDLFVGGMGDYLVIDYPNATNLAANSAASVVFRMARDGGNVPWSVYYALGEPEEKARAVHTRFTRALGRGMDWIMANEAEVFGDLLGRLFPAIPVPLMVTLADEYRAWGMWTTPTIDRDAYDRWQGGIARAGLTARPIPYEELVDTVPTTVISAA
jgi:NitT/TauT family transport system substrate-binding protein